MAHQITHVSIIELPSKSGVSNEKTRQELAKKVNHNNTLFNSAYSHGTNLIDYSDRIIFKKSVEEKLELKEAKKLWKQTNH